MWAFRISGKISSLCEIDGTGRVINKLCNASLTIGHNQSVNRITANIVMQAINDNTLG